MKIVSLIARILLAAIFLLAGSNHVFNFLPQPPPPPGLAGQFVTVMMKSGYLAVVGVFEVVPALLLLVNRLVPLALVILASVTVNILVADVLFTPVALSLGAVVVLLWCLAAWPVRSAFLPLLKGRITG